ncbi:MAG: hypothetical protein Q9207_001646 [Kuettlingeria erythrocarpa]
MEARTPGGETVVLPVDVRRIGAFAFKEAEKGFLGDWDIELAQDGKDATNLLQAVERLQTSNVPVAFPTETVYGLGADATRGDAVAGIYKAKRRPADNPLIVHISSLLQLRQLLNSAWGSEVNPLHGENQDPIPNIYHLLISRFWPGPLTILLPLPSPSPLAPSVTGTLSTFGARMPSSRLALALIHLSGLPIAAPSANASTRPSPTTAAHVLHDLSGRIEFIVDGGPCDVGVESTVVDGLVEPPVVLRPGGVSVEMLRKCPGWERVEVGYRDGAETGVPRAPGMKYKHYSPTARVILVHGPLSIQLVTDYLGTGSNIGLATTETWKIDHLTTPGVSSREPNRKAGGALNRSRVRTATADSMHDIASNDGQCDTTAISRVRADEKDEKDEKVIDIVATDLGTESATIARNLFSALRELDGQGVDVIFVEAITATEGHAAAAVMNRLRKAAEREVQI